MRREDTFELAPHARIAGDRARNALRPPRDVHHDGHLSGPLVDQARETVDLLAVRYVDVPAQRVGPHDRNGRRNEVRNVIGCHGELHARFVSGRGARALAEP